MGNSVFYILKNDLVLWKPISLPSANRYSAIIKSKMLLKIMVVMFIEQRTIRYSGVHLLKPHRSPEGTHPC